MPDPFPTFGPDAFGADPESRAAVAHYRHSRESGNPC